MEIFDLGEPIRQRKEANNYDEDNSLSEKSNIIDKVFYEEPEEVAEHIEDVENLIEETLEDTTEFYCEAINDDFDEFINEDDYGIFD